MAFLILTRAGFEALEKSLGRLPDNLWVNHEVLSDAELASYRTRGLVLTNFTTNIPTHDRNAINEALDTVAEHHPDEAIFVEWTDC